MTYCIGMLTEHGLVMLADTRTNAGVDNISTFRKLAVWELPGDRVIIQQDTSFLDEHHQGKTRDRLCHGVDTEYGVELHRSVGFDIHHSVTLKMSHLATAGHQSDQTSKPTLVYVALCDGSQMLQA